LQNGTDPIFVRFHPLDHIEQIKTMAFFASTTQQLERRKTAAFELNSEETSRLPFEFLSATYPNFGRQKLLYAVE
jgi:hypothetical protein